VIDCTVNETVSDIIAKVIDKEQLYTTAIDDQEPAYALVGINSDGTRTILRYEDSAEKITNKYGFVFILIRDFGPREPGNYPTSRDSELDRLEKLARDAEQRIQWNKEFELKKLSFSSTRKLSIWALVISIFSLLATIVKIVVDILRTP
jgi:hypothetical protein